MDEISKLFDEPKDAIDYLEMLRIKYKLGYVDGHLRQMAVMGYVMQSRITELEQQVKEAEEDAEYLAIHLDIGTYEGRQIALARHRARLQKDGEG